MHSMARAQSAEICEAAVNPSMMTKIPHFSGHMNHQRLDSVEPLRKPPLTTVCYAVGRLRLCSLLIGVCGSYNKQNVQVRLNRPVQWHRMFCSHSKPLRRALKHPEETWHCHDYLNAAPQRMFAMLEIKLSYYNRTQRVAVEWRV